MKFSMRRSGALIATAAAAAVALAGCTSAPADDAGSTEPAPVDFPKGNITLIVPYGAGGPSDISARALAQDLEAELGVTVVVENRPGASGITGLSEVAIGAADGYTLTYTTGDSFVQSGLREGVAYDFASFEPIAGTISQPYVLVTGSNGVDDFAALSKKGSVTYASTGNGTPTHLNTLMMFDQLGVTATQVPFNGAAEATQALVGNQVDVAMLDASVAMPQITAGALKPLAVLSADGEALEYLEDIKTLEDLGIDTSAMTTTVWGVAAPAGTDPAVVDILRAAVLAAVEGSNFQEFTQANYMPLLTGDNELNWYTSLADIAKKSKAALEKFGVSLT
ncbi:tripartite tricarboxylate transporter substrate binding protein [Salinibacterium sp. ZJ70]|uniref:tripartite tricarboxylate transporter substrate binding protein n=1 Tax=Salinibacterium sp. ZJ70 TaxID=2708084 RepID=UPI00141E5052|nr:tripartite tricarboxylate transporter substrate binding protein [Salinibacterium sp. ZJ70]